MGNMTDNEGCTNTTYDRTQTGNRAYNANSRLLRSKVNTKMKIYKTLISPVVAYGGETCTLAKVEQESLRKFEVKIVRYVYGPVKKDVEWRVSNNQETDEQLKHEDMRCF